jgi:tetratricopeptide (TPR) repeat protein
VSRKELIIGAVVAVILISFGIARVIMRPPPEQSTTDTVAGTADYTPSTDEKSAIEKAHEKKEALAKEQAREAIAEHERAIANDWAAPDTPDRLMAVGNLYQYQLDQYDTAIQKYASIVNDYPDHYQTPQAYIEMAKCYERKGDQVQAEYVYEEIIEKLDPSLQHVAYAKQRLGEM